MKNGRDQFASVSAPVRNPYKAFASPTLEFRVDDECPIPPCARRTQGGRSDDLRQLPNSRSHTSKSQLW